MLARVLAMALCPSVASRSFIEMTERIELVLARSFLPPILYTVVKGSSGIFKNKGTSNACRTLSQTPDLENFIMVYRSSKRVIDLARERWTL